jgi:hypothetical protein
VQFAIPIDLAALLPSLADDFGLANIFQCPLAPPIVQPGIKPTGWMPRHRYIVRMETANVLGHKRVSRFASFAKYAVAFYRMSRSSVTLASSRFNRLISVSRSPPDGPAVLANFFFQP